jgi:hypothetical protein
MSKLLGFAYTDGPALTAAAAASCLPTYALPQLPAGYFAQGRMLRITAAGRITSAVTTPGTARFDVRLGGTVVFDTGAQALNTTAQTNVPWWLEILLTCRNVGSGTSTNFMGVSRWNSTDTASDHGHGSAMVLPTSAPAVGNGVNVQSALPLDLFFTQTVATGSLTLHQFAVEQLDDF